MKFIDLQDVEYIALGAALLGTGGGDPHLKINGYSGDKTERSSSTH